METKACRTGVTSAGHRARTVTRPAHLLLAPHSQSLMKVAAPLGDEAQRTKGELWQEGSGIKGHHPVEPRKMPVGSSDPDHLSRGPPLLNSTTKALCLQSTAGQMLLKMLYVRQLQVHP